MTVCVDARENNDAQDACAECLVIGCWAEDLTGSIPEQCAWLREHTPVAKWLRAHCGYTMVMFYRHVRFMFSAYRTIYLPSPLETLL